MEMESTKKRSPVNRYLMALIAPAVTAGVMQVSWPFFQNTPVSPYFMPVILCAWYGGLGPGLLSVFISFLLAHFFFVEPYFSLSTMKNNDQIRLLVFVTVGTIVSWLSELMHKARQHAEINLEATKRAEEALREKERFANQIA